MAPPRVIQGTPGDRWTNDTGDLWYQLHVAGWHTCGFCWSLDGKIARRWAVPFHSHCRCRVSAVLPGRRAPAPFVDYRERLLKLPAHDQDAVMGRSLRRLWRRGVIELADTIGPDGVRTLESVVASHRIPVRAMVVAGIPEGIARRAHEAAQRLPADAHARRYAAVLARATGLDGLHRPTIQHLARAAATAALPLGGLASLGAVADRRKMAADLAGLLAAPIRREERLTDVERKTILATLGPEPARSVAAFLSAARSILAAGQPLPAAITPIYRRLTR